MGSTQPFFRRAFALALAPVAVAFGLVVPAAQSASAAVALPTPVSQNALPTVQVNGVVWTQSVVGNTVFAGGRFDTAQPSGAAAGVGGIHRSNLLAYNLTTGDLIPSFAPSINAQVRGIAASPDGRRIYIVGDFTTVDGQPREHIAALDSATGSLVAGFSPAVNAKAYTVVATSSTVYVGGAFTAVNGTARTRAAAVTAATGQLTPWAPVIPDYAVRALALDPDGSKLVIGGSFTSVNGMGHPGHGLAAVDSNTGKSVPWAAGNLIYNNGQNGAIYSLSARGDTVYATGYGYGGLQNANLEGTIAMRWSDGGVVWIEDCHGDTYSSVAFDGAVYVATHAHYCKNIGGFDETDPITYHRALAFSQAATGTVAHNTQNPDHYFDFGGYPAPTLLNWEPQLHFGTYTGMYQAAWSVAAGGSYVVYGGEFTEVNGVRQTGLTRFLGRPDPAPVVDPTPVVTPTPTPKPVVHKAPSRVARPAALALGPTRVAVKWTAPKDAKASKLTQYKVQVYRASHPVKSVTVSSKHLRTVVLGLQKHVHYRVAVFARNSVGWAQRSLTAVVNTPAHGRTVSSVKLPSKMAKPSVHAARTSIKVNWKAARTTGATSVTSYQVRVYRGSKFVTAVSVSARHLSATVAHLAKGTTYTVRVRALNWAGYSTMSTAASTRTRH